MWLVAPVVAFGTMFGVLIHEAFEQDKINRDNKDKVVQYEKLKKEYAGYKLETSMRVSELEYTVDVLTKENKELNSVIAKLKQDSQLYLNGKTYFVTKSFTGEATAYTPRDEEGTADGITATEKKATEGRTIAVDPNVIPLGSLVYIESDSPYVGGFYVAEDTGGAIKGNKIDVYMDSLDQAFKFGRQKIKVTVLKGADL